MLSLVQPLVRLLMVAEALLIPMAPCAHSDACARVLLVVPVAAVVVPFAVVGVVWSVAPEDTMPLSSSRDALTSVQVAPVVMRIFWLVSAAEIGRASCRGRGE